MAGTAKIDIVQQIGDTLTELDILAASPDLSDAEFNAIKTKRKKLDRQQLELVKQAFREDTQKFQNAATAVKTVNDDLNKTIDDVTKVAETLAAVASLITSLDKLISIAIP